jgi:Family of unknown function (DUF5335)
MDLDESEMNESRANFLMRTHHARGGWRTYSQFEEAVMRDRQIPRAEWADFFKAFSFRHADAPATVRVLSSRFGCQVEACELPFEGIAADRTGGGSISIHAGRNPEQHVAHDVPNPVQIWVEIADDGTEEALDIESDDGTKTLVIFRAETVDDVLRRA